VSAATLALLGYLAAQRLWRWALIVALAIPGGMLLNARRGRDAHLDRCAIIEAGTRGE
jgi:hypothetical protein